MSFIQDLADYVALNTSLVVDTDLFIAEEPASSPDECVILITSPGLYRYYLKESLLLLQKVWPRLYLIY